MKKLFAILLVLCMVVALAACGGSKNTVVGTWTGTADARQTMIEAAPELADYLKAAPFSVTMTFNSDGTYSYTIDGTPIIPEMRTAVRSYLEDYIKQQGFTVAEFEEAAKMTMDQAVESVMEEVDLSDLSQTGSGTYTESNGQLVLDAGSNDEVNATWSGDVINFTVEEFGTIILTRK